MKLTTIQLGNNKIELINSSLGEETVKVNGEIVSCKYSMLGTNHEFTIAEDGKQVNCSVQFGFGAQGLVFDFYKDGIPIIKSERASTFWGFAIVMVIIAVIAVAIDYI